MKYLRIDLKEMKRDKQLLEVSFRAGKCFYCDGKSQSGTHDICWKIFKGWMVDNDDGAFIQPKLDETSDNYMNYGQTFYDKAGRHIVQGHVMKPSSSD